MSSTITILEVFDVLSDPKSEQIWIVPGTEDDRLEENQQYSGWYVMDYLAERGICISRGIEPEKKAKLVEDIREKFEKQGFTVVVTFTAND